MAEARDHFADHCAQCHANDGSGQTQINAGLYPPAPDMREEGTQKLTDGELLYIIKNGIRFTGMPGWGGEGEENWKLVLFIRHLPDLTPSEIELMREINGLETAQEGGQPSAAPHEHSQGRTTETALGRFSGYWLGGTVVRNLLLGIGSIRRQETS